MENKITSFEVLSQLDISKQIEKKQNANYLSWSHAVAHVLKRFPDMTYTVIKNDNGLPYFIDDAGAIVYTAVTIEGITREMWLPVLDGAFKTMKRESYDYKVINYEWVNGKKIKKGFKDKTCECINMFEVNKTIMRCLTKNLAMFGLGINVYAGEDLPLELEIIKFMTQTQSTKIKKLFTDTRLTKEDFLKVYSKYNTNFKEITEEQAITLIEELEKIKKDMVAEEKV